jgi:DNA-binding FadR family transcriptional regulator
MMRAIRILQNALQLIRNLMMQWIGGTLSHEGVAQEALDQHKQIFLGIAKRNTEQARTAMHHHLDALTRHLQESQSPAALQGVTREESTVAPEA